MLAPPSSLRKLRRLRRSQPPKDGEVPLGSARCLTPQDPQAALESGDGFADRSPARCLTPLDPPAALESGDSFANRSPPDTARSRSDPRGASPHWTHQQPSNAATIPPALWA
eukprot:3330084-Pyramimonas_sp.AAC.1